MQLIRRHSCSTAVSFLRDTKTIGDLSELIVALRLTQAGYSVARPLGENRRYDLLIDDGIAISRVQVKTGRLRRGVIQFHPYSTHSHRKGISCKPYVGQIDFFAVYCPELDAAYLVPIGDTARLCGVLRVHATKNGQSSNVRWAHRYLITAVPRPGLALSAVGGQAVDGVSKVDPETPS